MRKSLLALAQALVAKNGLAAPDTWATGANP